MKLMCRVSSVPPSQRFGVAGEWQESALIQLSFTFHVSRFTFST
jgi:hypothetical protein